MKFVGKGLHLNTLVGRKTTPMRAFSHVVSNRTPETQVSPTAHSLSDLGPGKNRKLYSD